MLFSMLLGPSDCPRLQFNVLSIDYVRVTNCFYDYDYDLAASTIAWVRSQLHPFWAVVNKSNVG